MYIERVSVFREIEREIVCKDRERESVCVCVHVERVYADCREIKRDSMYVER